jgi:hypothetical protein
MGVFLYFVKCTDYKSFTLNSFYMLLYFLCLGYKYSPQHHIFRDPPSVTQLMMAGLILNGAQPGKILNSDSSRMR